MSWLSSGIDKLTGADDEWAAQQNAIAAENAREQALNAQAAQAAEANRQAALRASWDAARGGAKTSASSYFSDRGLDPNQYGGAIDSAISDALSTVSPNDPTPGLYLKNIGQGVYTSAQDAAREKALRGANATFAPDFEMSRISNATDDPFIADVMKGQRGDADAYINNLLKRGVVTKTGYDAGVANLNNQDARVRSTLSDLGSGLLDTGRQGLTNIANRAKTNASTLDLGTNFDPSVYSKEADTSFNDFLSSLGDKLKAQVPGNLYDTSGLASVAGAAQGAQNLPFDPSALAGLITPNPDEDPNKKKPTGFSF
jgi:hypothetical protein